MHCLRIIAVLLPLYLRLGALCSLCAVTRRNGQVKGEEKTLKKMEWKEKQKMELSDTKRNCSCRVDENLLRSNIGRD